MRDQLEKEQKEQTERNLWRVLLDDAYDRSHSAPFVQLLIHRPRRLTWQGLQGWLLAGAAIVTFLAACSYYVH